MTAWRRDNAAVRHLAVRPKVHTAHLQGVLWRGDLLQTAGSLLRLSRRPRRSKDKKERGKKKDTLKMEGWREGWRAWPDDVTWEWPVRAGTGGGGGWSHNHIKPVGWHECGGVVGWGCKGTAAAHKGRQYSLLQSRKFPPHAALFLMTLATNQRARVVTATLVQARSVTARRFHSRALEEQRRGWWWFSHWTSVLKDKKPNQHLPAVVWLAWHVVTTGVHSS